MDPVDEDGQKKKHQAAQRSRKRTSLRVAAAAVAIGMVLVANQVWNAGDNGGSGSSSGGGVTQTPTTTEEPDVPTTLADPGQAVEPTCPEEDGSSPRQLQFTAPPPDCAFDLSKRWIALVDTNRGHFEITLDGEAAPTSVNNFIFLALWHFYDGASFHHIVPDFAIQGGDPIGPTPGDGGPGYTLQPEPPQAGPYTELSVVMAGDGGAAHGSQFLILVGPEGEELPLDYTRIGSVTAGKPVVEDIAATGSDDGVPSEPTVVEEVAVGVRE